jgi:hypothetical protein
VSTCAKCNDSGFVAVCVEPMAGLAGYESEPCGCTPVKRLPMPEPVAPAPTVSPLEAAWAEVDAALVRARAIGPRPLPPRIPCPPCATCGLRESEFGDICPPCEEAEYQAAQKVLT